VHTMDDQRTSAAARRAALRAAATKHTERVAECHAGRAPEQHLWELQRIARQQGRKMGIYEVPQLYESPGWTKMRADELSVRSTSSPHTDYLGTGPADGPGIGAAHVLAPGSVQVHLSAPSRHADELDTFRDELVRAVTELRELLSDVGRVRGEHRRTAARSLLCEPRRAQRRRVGVVERLPAAVVLVGLSGPIRGLGQHRDGPEETLIGTVFPRHRAEALPTRFAELVEATMVAGTGVGVSRHGVTIVQRTFRERGPCLAEVGVLRGGVRRVGGVLQRGFGVGPLR